MRAVMGEPDRVRLEGLVVDAPIGVYAHEHGVLQKLEIDLIVETDIRAAAANDAIEEAIDYDGLARAARAIAQARHHALIETVAERIADRLLGELGPRARRIFVRVTKPGAVAGARAPSVEVWREHPHL